MIRSCDQTQSFDDTDSPRCSKNIEVHRWLELMDRLKHLSRLHQQGVQASILERQKRREVAFKRANVWRSDAKFMREIQSLGAKGKLDQFKDLPELAKECQAARDTLGPMENDLAVVVQQWESQSFQLRRVEEDIYHEFKSEFELALEHPSISENGSDDELEQSFCSESDGASNEQVYTQEEAHGDDERLPDRSFTVRTHSSNFSRITPFKSTYDSLEAVPTQTSMLLGIGQRGILGNDTGQVVFSNSTHKQNPDSEVKIGIEPLGNRQSHLFCQTGSNEYLDDTNLQHGLRLLSENEGQGEGRISQWLLQILLLSRAQATILKSYIDAENLETPQNWAQLVLALWEDDGSTTGNEKSRDISIYTSG